MAVFVVFIINNRYLRSRAVNQFRLHIKPFKTYWTLAKINIFRGRTHAWRIGWHILHNGLLSSIWPRDIRFGEPFRRNIPAFYFQYFFFSVFFSVNYFIINHDILSLLLFSLRSSRPSFSSLLLQNLPAPDLGRQFFATLHLQSASFPALFIYFLLRFTLSASFPAFPSLLAQFI